MFVYVKRRVLDAETAARVELRLLEGHPELGYHWVDVPNRGVRGACGLNVDSFSQWQRHRGTDGIVMCRDCARAMSAPGDLVIGV